MQALDLFGARSRNRTGTPLRAGDFKSHASTSFAIRAVARVAGLGIYRSGGFDARSKGGFIASGSQQKSLLDQ